MDFHKKHKKEFKKKHFEYFFLFFSGILDDVYVWIYVYPLEYVCIFYIHTYMYVNSLANILHFYMLFIVWGRSHTFRRVGEFTSPRFETFQIITKIIAKQISRTTSTMQIRNTHGHSLNACVWTMRHEHHRHARIRTRNWRAEGICCVDS